MTTLRDPLASLLGAKSAKALAKTLGIETVGSLLRHYPRRYTERGELTDIAGLEVGEHVTVAARIVHAARRQMRSRKGSILELRITDGTRELACAFFRNTQWLAQQLQPGKTGLFAGKVTAFHNKLQLTHPEFELFDEHGRDSAVYDFVSEIIPVYPAAAGLPSWTIDRCVQQVWESIDVDDDPMPIEVRAWHGLADLTTALQDIHRPADWDALERARHRLKWDEAMAIQLIFAERRMSAISRSAPACGRIRAGLLDAFDARLPFALTEGQRSLGEAIADDITTEQPMNRLLQGEVGSGKTVVALRAMLQAVDAGKQAAMLAPTEVLAAQHARSVRELLGELGCAGELGAAENATTVTVLTGSLPAKQRKQALLEAASGQAGIVVGTHALIQEHVSFADLGLVVVDEQHRFGVEQRDALRGRGAGFTSPHVLVMTATPIPRTVAMSVYGDLEVSVLTELPQGRSSITTSLVPAAEKPSWLQRVWKRVREEVAAGNQVYVVCPRVGDEPPADHGTTRPPHAVLDLAAELEQDQLAGLRIAALHGRMPADDKDTVMRRFAAGALDVLVATTVIEVGVDVGNATVMVVLDADRFGVSQLHQLRGRVGRGHRPGLCLLVTDALEGTRTRQRLSDVESTTDGFRLSRLDLEMRREGDILGVAQSGQRSGLRLLSLLRDEEIIAGAREHAQEIIGQDPSLGHHLGLAHLVADLVGPDRAEFLEKT